MTHCVLPSTISVQESAAKHLTVLSIALTEREETGGSCQCLGSVWRHFVPREGGQLGPQSTGPLSQLVPWALWPLTNLLVDKFTWRPNKCSPIIATFNFMVSFTPWNEWYEAPTKYWTAETVINRHSQLFPYQLIALHQMELGHSHFTAGFMPPLALTQKRRLDKMFEKQNQTLRPALLGKVLYCPREQLSQADGRCQAETGSCLIDQHLCKSVSPFAKRNERGNTKLLERWTTLEDCEAKVKVKLHWKKHNWESESGKTHTASRRR